MSKLHLVEKWFAAVEKGDFEFVRALYAPAATIWHNDGSPEQSPEENVAMVTAVASVLSDLRYDVVRRVEVADGVFSQHVLRGGLPDGTELHLDAAMFVHVADDKIQRVEEYIDTAQATTLIQALSVAGAVEPPS
ncbi:nuclear transport factor 2 family protein [Spirillospora sp. CA-255316]